MLKAIMKFLDGMVNTFVGYDERGWSVIALIIAVIILIFIIWKIF